MMALENTSSSNDTKLDLSNRGLSELPDDFVSLLQQVDEECDGGVIELSLFRDGLPPAIPAITLSPNVTRSIVTINLTENRFEQLPKQITHLTSLKELVLKHNRLKSLPENLIELKKLEHLDLSGNHLDNFPRPILSLPSLSFLHLGGNQMRSIPPEIRNLTELRFLYLGGNRLTHIPAEIGDLSKMSGLSLCGNQIQHLPRELTKLTNLRLLQLHDNLLQTLPPGTMDLRNLEELSLRGNPLVLRFIKEWGDTVPSLLELSGRVAKRCDLSYDPSTVPETLCDFLDSSRCCDNPTCEGVYFVHKVRNVKFVDFCGKYRIPLMQYLCSPMCYGHDESLASSSEDETDEVARHRISKVLLG